MDNTAVGNYIRVLRRNKGMTQRDLADKLSLSFQAVSKWETGETLPDTGILLDLCDILDTSVDKLLSGGSFLRKERKQIRMESIAEGFDHIARVKECLGAENDFYRAMMDGIRDAMKFDFEEAFQNHREVLYTEAVIRFLTDGYKIDIDEVKAFIHQEKLIQEILRRL